MDRRSALVAAIFSHMFKIRDRRIFQRLHEYRVESSGDCIGATFGAMPAVLADHAWTIEDMLSGNRVCVTAA